MRTKSDKATITRLLKRAIEIAGSEKKLGDASGYSQNAIWDAKRRGTCTAEMAIAIDRATSGEVGKHELRPDLFDPPIAAAAA